MTAIKIPRKPHIATATLAAINHAIEIDQGAKFRGLQKKYMDMATDPFDTDLPEPRSHMGASVIGGECERAIWYGWRWASNKGFSGQMLRLFNRGHLEEPRMLALLELIGCEIWSQDAEGKQWRMTGYKGHYGGGSDAVLRGIVEMPDVAMMGEFKTHNAKSFGDLENKGVRAAKFTHFVQMQQYMVAFQLDHCLYMATNKDTDDLYIEIVYRDDEIANVYFARAERLIDTEEVPKKLSTDSSFWKCKFCDFQGVCHNRKIPLQNCRTCVHSKPVNDGKWSCELKKVLLTKQEQLAGCRSYELKHTLRI